METRSQEDFQRLWDQSLEDRAKNASYRSIPKHQKAHPDPRVTWEEALKPKTCFLILLPFPVKPRRKLSAGRSELMNWMLKLPN